MTLRELGELPVGTEAAVERVEGPRALRRRLLEMGLLPGTVVRIVRRAPMGDPLELRLRGFSLSLRRRDANAIRVRAAAATSAEPVGAEATAEPAPKARAAARTSLPA